MIVPAKHTVKVQELVELEDLNKTYIKSRFILLLLKVDFEKITKLFTTGQDK